MKRPPLALLLAPLVLAACSDEDTTGLEAGADVTIRFATAAAEQPGEGGSLVLEGNNGTLVVQDVKLIVSELELEAEDGFCDDSLDDGLDGDSIDDGLGDDSIDDGLDDDLDLGCAEFEAAPFLLDLPPAGGEVTIVTREVPSDIYTELQLELEDLEADDDDERSDRDEIARIRDILTATFGVIPAGTSLIVSGFFVPLGSAVPEFFTVFFDADLDVELELFPAFVVTTEGISQTLTVTLDIAPLFRTDGNVVDLSTFDRQLVDPLADLGFDFEQAFDVEVEAGND